MSISHSVHLGRHYCVPDRKTNNVVNEFEHNLGLTFEEDRTTSGRFCDLRTFCLRRNFISSFFFFSSDAEEDVGPQQSNANEIG